MDLVDRGDGRPLEPVLIDGTTGQQVELTNVRAIAGRSRSGHADFFNRLRSTGRDTQALGA